MSALRDAKGEYIERSADGRTLHLVSEIHYSRYPIDTVHDIIVPKVAASPDYWLFLLEGAAERTASQEYVCKMAGLWNIPCEEALADLNSLDTRKWMKERGGLEERDIDRLLLSASLSIFTRQDAQHLIQRLAQMVGKSEGYVGTLLFDGEDPPMDWESLQKLQNECSRERYPLIMGAYPSTTKILINVGKSHMGVFL